MIPCLLGSWSLGAARPLGLSGASVRREPAPHRQPDGDQSPARRSLGARCSRGVGSMAEPWSFLSAHPGRELHSVRRVVAWFQIKGGLSPWK